ncbi:MAG TPA: hypothetical protein VEF76_10520 [Patescibacteria group bacterium]|nr:hypothetical protein [Patescibacteria group bacterium]
MTTSPSCALVTAMILLAVPAAYSATPQPAQAGGLGLQRSGNDLLINTGNGIATIKDFFIYGAEDQLQKINIQTPNDGRCVLTIDSNANIVDAQCEK